MDDDTLALLSDLDILLSDSVNIPQTVCEDNGQLGGDYCSISYIYGDFTEVQPLPLPHPHTPLPVYSKNNNASSIEVEEPRARKTERHDKGSGKVTKVELPLERACSLVRPIICIYACLGHVVLKHKNTIFEFFENCFFFY